MKRILNGVSSDSLTAGFSLDEGLLKKDYGASPGEPDNAVSFPFSWSHLPAGTKALALTLIDQSYDNYVHWLAA